MLASLGFNSYLSLSSFRGSLSHVSLTSWMALLGTTEFFWVPSSLPPSRLRKTLPRLLEGPHLEEWKISPNSMSEPSNQAGKRHWGLEGGPKVSIHTTPRSASLTGRGVWGSSNFLWLTSGNLSSADLVPAFQIPRASDLSFFFTT